MDKKDLEALAEKYQKKADEKYMLYQETGLTRYDTEYRKNDDLAAAMRMAADAEEDHAALIAMRGMVSSFASSAAEAKRAGLSEAEREKIIDALLRDLIAYGRMNGLIGAQ